MSIFEISLFGITMAPKWYWAMYALGFLISYLFVKKWGRLSLKELDSLLLYVFIGVVWGGRIGYILFYNLNYYLSSPGNIIRIWEGGMSFHGGLLGVITAVYLYSKMHKKSFFSLTDTLAIIVPVAIFLWRWGNYINKELLWFSPYSGPLGIEKNGIVYFPSPLLEMLLEGLFLFLIMVIAAKKFWFFRRSNEERRQHEWLLSAIFLTGYSTMRLIAEQFRLPDIQVGYLFSTHWITLGMMYTLPLLWIGMFLLYSRTKNIK